MKLRRKYRWILGNVTFWIIVGILLWTAQVYYLDVSRSKERALLNAKVYAEEISKDFQRGVSISGTIKAMLIDNNGKINNFDTVAKGLMEDYIGSIQLAPGGVVESIYPMGGNEAGKIDLLNDPNRGPSSRYSKEQDMVVMQGPFELAQGGQEIAIRNPVFITQEDGSSEFWGFAIVIIKSPEIFHESLDALVSFGNEYTLDTTNVLINNVTSRVTGTIGEEEILTDAVSYSFNAGGNEWTISVRRERGWISPRTWWISLGACVIGLMLIIMTYLILRQREQKKQLEKLAVSADAANAAKTNFLSNMAHDIRTPLNAVIGLSELAGRHLDERAKAEYYVQQIGFAGKQLLQIINGILEITSIENDKIEIKEEIVDSSEVFDTLQMIFMHQADANHIRFNFTNEISHRYLYSDKLHVEEILTNLVSNAMKYTPEDGCVDVRFTELPSDRDGYVIIRSAVKDNGIGMSEEFLEKIYGKFEREDDETVGNIQGTGLGMAIVKRLVDMMGGTITVTSRKGLGTLAQVDLPHRIAQAPQSDDAEKHTDRRSAENSAGKRILLAEDNDINAMIAEDILSDEGFVIERAVDGKQCTQMLEAAADDYYDLILMDINMPVMDGYEAMKVIRSMQDKKKAAITIIAMTANAFEEDKKRVLEAGMNAHVAKPIDTTQLCKLLEECE